MAPARTPSALTEVTRESAAVLASEAARTASDHLPVVARFR
jgi:endonuclease/exonuclease/phosphatase family metal-dependent hydrolase